MLDSADRRVQELNSSLARLSRENQSRAHNERKLRIRSDRLENAIRLHATGECDCHSERECLARLYRLIPVKPR